METKKWYQSKSVIGSIVAVISMILSAFGYGISGPDQVELVNIVISASGGIGALIALYGRIVAEHKLR